MYRRPSLSPNTLILSLLLLLPNALAAVTVYTNAGATTTVSALAAGQTYAGLPAYDPTYLTAPSPPSPPLTSTTVQLPANGQAVWDGGFQLSVAQRGNFLGFSVELSVASSLLGKDAAHIHPQILNYLANIKTRAGQGALVRVGGNSQEGSSLWVGGFEGDTSGSIQKIYTGTAATTTPIVNYNLELFYTMSNITSLVGTEWFFGLSFNETEVTDPTGNVPIAAKYATQILGSSLRGLQVGNEPDLYSDHDKRPQGYTVQNFIDEFNNVTSDIVSGAGFTDQMVFVGPSICCQTYGFDVGDFLNANFIGGDADKLTAVTVQHYPSNNCQVGGNIINAQDIFYQFLNHTSAQSLTSWYLPTSSAAVAAGKDMIMLEMNTASCGGFPGLSDSFGAAMWMADWALQMAWGNFTAALMHVGGQNVYYNPFTPPPSNLSTTYEWTTGSVYYPTLLIAEAFGKSNNSRVVDLSADADIYHPIYAIYENDAPSRVVLFNFVDDPSGASLWNAQLNNLTLASQNVSVRYFEAPSVSEQYNITWAGQNMGTSFASDGRLYGDVQTVPITCQDGSCTIPVPAPAIALVFLTDQALSDSTPSAAEATATYATTVVGTGSATIDPAALETSNGQNGKMQGSTSEGSVKSAAYPSVGISKLMGGIMGLMSIGWIFWA